MTTATYEKALISGNLNTVRASLEDWSLPRTQGNWAYANGTLAYSFEDEFGDGYCGYFCGHCAGRMIRTQTTPDGYITLTALQTSFDLQCDTCGEELGN